MKYKTANIFFQPDVKFVDEDECPKQYCSAEHIQTALDMVYEYFGSRKDKSGKPMSLHSISVGLMGVTDDETVVGLLHDLLEDTHITEEMLYRKFPRVIINTVKLLTRNPETKYFDYIQAIKESGNKLAIKVKMNDLSHNLLRASVDEMSSLSKRYRKAIRILSDSE